MEIKTAAATWQAHGIRRRGGWCDGCWLTAREAGRSITLCAHWPHRSHVISLECKWKELLRPTPPVCALLFCCRWSVRCERPSRNGVEYQEKQQSTAARKRSEATRLRGFTTTVRRDPLLRVRCHCRHRGQLQRVFVCVGTREDNRSHKLTSTRAPKTPASSSICF